MPARKRVVRGPYLATDVPRAARCSSCGRAVLVGNLYGLPFKYDQQHLNRKGEGEAIIRRLRTFHINLIETHLTERRPWSIIRQPKPRWGYIIREHRCTAPEPDPRGVETPEEHSPVCDF